MVIDQIQAFRVAMPLTSTYKVSYVALDTLNLLLVVVRAGSKIAFGETLDGRDFFWEYPQDPWTFVQEAAPRLIGMDPESAYAELLPALPNRHRAAEPLLTALEQLRGSAAVRLPVEPLVAPILGTVLSFDLAKIPSEVDHLIESDFRTLKVKVGFGVEDDITRAKLIQERVAGRAKLRFDANMAYTYNEALKFARTVDPQDVELFEQPFPPAEWAMSARLVGESPLPLMLDESIHGPADIDRAAGLGAKFVKFKLLKAGSMERLLEWIYHAFDRGLEVVIGNGAAADPACFHEALVVGRHLRTAGENNGFLKCRVPLLAAPLPFGNGAIQIPAGYAPELDLHAVRSLSRDELNVS